MNRRESNPGLPGVRSTLPATLKYFCVNLLAGRFLVRFVFKYIKNVLNLQHNSLHKFVAIFLNCSGLNFLLYEDIVSNKEWKAQAIPKIG